jgi:hypothetical protein
MTENNEYFTWEFTDNKGEVQTVTFVSAGEVPVGVIDDAMLPENQNRSNFIIMKEAAKTEEDYNKLRLMRSKEFKAFLEAYNAAE